MISPEEFNRHFIEPEAELRAGKRNPGYPPWLGTSQTQKRVGLDRRVQEHLERNKGIVLGLDQQGRHTNPVEVTSDDCVA